MKKIELLAPAGNMEAFKAAIHAECDAIYIGGTFFGARNYAGNFDEQQMREAIDLAHLYGIKVYITVNTLIYEIEVKVFMHYIDTLVEMNVDALILQDIGMADLIKQTYPDLELHASTQMHIHTLEGVLFAQKMGFKRVVLARETSVDIIRDIRRKTELELEVFGHGALCISYSGQCLMSSLIGGRSGNRGTCAQSCRQKYDLIENGKKVNEDSYLLSMKDLNILENIKEFIESGASSLKIEGRMKRPEYVYLVVSIYRKAIDEYYKTGKVHISEEDKEQLKNIFNRKFTKGFLFGEKNDNVVHSYRPNHMGTQIGKVISCTNLKVFIKLSKALSERDGIRILNKEEDVGLTIYQMKKEGQAITEASEGDLIEIVVPGSVIAGDIVLKTSDQKQLNRIDKALKGPQRKVSISGKISIHKNKPILLTITDGIYTIEQRGTIIIEPAQNCTASHEEIQKNMDKLGNTVYKWTNFEIDLEEGLFVPVKELSELRRKSIEGISKKRLERKKITKGTYGREVPNFEKTQDIAISIQTFMQYEIVKEIPKVNFIYAEEELYHRIKEDPRVILKLPRIMQSYPIHKEKLLVGEVGSLYQYEKTVTDFSLNVVNSYTLAFLHSMGVYRVTMSYELNDADIVKILANYQDRYGKNPNVECIVYGREEAMVMKYNILEKYKCKEGYLKDRFGNLYPIQNHQTFTSLYNYKVRNSKSYHSYYNLGISTLRFNVLEDSEIRNIKDIKFLM